MEEGTFALLCLSSAGVSTVRPGLPYFLILALLVVEQSGDLVEDHFALGGQLDLSCLVVGEACRQFLLKLLIALALVGLQLSFSSSLVLGQTHPGLMPLHVRVHTIDQVVLLALILGLVEDLLHSVVHL